MTQHASFNDLVETWREGEWQVEVRLRGVTFGTEAQARETAERWRRLVAVAAQRDVELLEVVVHGGTGHRTDECRAVVHHGPGHQSGTPCERYGPHELHEAHVAGHSVFWRGEEGCTGALDESPLDEDDPYTHVESRGYWVACCRACDDGQPLPQPFESNLARDEWCATHAEGTGHAEFYCVDPPEGAAEALARWRGTVAYEGVETTDGRVLEQLSWPRLVLGPLPVVELGTGRPVGTITEVWREAVEPRDKTLSATTEDLPEGAVRVHARGTVLRSAVGPDGRVALGVDVTGGEVDSRSGKLVLRRGKLLGLTIYPEGSGSTPAWPDAALQLEEATP